MHLDVFAYLDPGTGSLLVQSLIGAVVGAGIFGRRVISSAGRRAKNLLTRTREEVTEK